MRLVYGLQPVREALRAHGSQIVRCVVDERSNPALEGLLRLAQSTGTKIERLPRRELDAIAKGGHHQGVMAWAPELRLWQLSELDIGASTLIAILDGLTDPQNFGAAVRSAVALGATAVIWPENASAPLSPAMFRASAGAVEHATLCRVASLGDTVRALTDRNVLTVALEAHAPQGLSAVDLTGPVALVLGAEDKGLHKPVRQACSTSAKIDMPGKIGSFNASVAIALALYETQRQRGPAVARGPG